MGVMCPVEHPRESGGLKPPDCCCRGWAGGSWVMKGPLLGRSWESSFAQAAERQSMQPEMTPSHVAMAALGPGEGAFQPLPQAQLGRGSWL